MNIISFNDYDIQKTVETNGDYLNSFINVVNPTLNSIVISTQDWCPQWHTLNGWIKELKNQKCELTVILIIYNKSKYFREFMFFKENFWKNDLVPYIRYYKKGIFSGESNLIDYETFIKKSLS